MGPFVLAGLTHDTSRVVLPSDNVADQLLAFDTAGLASILALPQKVYDKRNMCGDENHKDPYCRAEDIFTEALDGNGYYMKLDKRHVTAASDISTTADAMDATFRVVSTYNRCEASQHGSSTYSFLAVVLHCLFGPWSCKVPRACVSVDCETRTGSMASAVFVSQGGGIGGSSIRHIPLGLQHVP